MSKFIVRMLPLPVLAVLLLAGVRPANAQGISAYFGLGSAWNSAARTPDCPPGQIDDPTIFPQTTGTCLPVSGMGGVFGLFGADFMIKPHLGINGEYTFRFAQASYLGPENSIGIPINIRPAFYDFNAVYQPTGGDKTFVPVLEGGIGGAKMSFYLSQTGTAFSQSSYFISSSHFALHGAAGVKWYLHGDVFLKPQVDLRYVPHLTNQYGRNFVPQLSVSIGYTFGRE